MSKRQVERFFRPDSWGKPVWESMPKGLADKEAVRNATRTTYLGRLTPLTRAIWLVADGRTLILANGIEYGSYAGGGWREPSATIVTRNVRGQHMRVVLPASLSKAAWRELHSLAVKSVGQNPGGPAAMENIFDEEPFDLWVGGLVAKQAKPVDTVESVFRRIPAAMLTETSHMVYELGVRLAKDAEFQLVRAVSVYHKALGDNLDRPEMRNRRSQIQSIATAHFWTDIENVVPHLLEVAVESLGLKFDWRKTAWGRSVHRTARVAYERACPHKTPRQIRAYALGLKTLFTATAKHPEVETEQEAEA